MQLVQWDQCFIFPPVGTKGSKCSINNKYPPKRISKVSYLPVPLIDMTRVLEYCNLRILNIIILPALGTGDQVKVERVKLNIDIASLPVLFYTTRLL